MAAQVIPFASGKILSGETIVSITPGTDAAAFTGAQSAARNRRWAVTEAAAAANLPYNPCRRLVIINNEDSTQDAYVVITSAANPAATGFVWQCEAGGVLELSRELGEVGPEAMAVVLGGTTVSACVVTERSAVL